MTEPTTILPVHPDDLLFFNEVAAAMRRVAHKYELPLRSVQGLPMPKEGMADKMGVCNSSGDIRLVMRCTENGEWCHAPLSPDEVWETAAHELAHLRHFNHGREHEAFTLEMRQALVNVQPDRQQKILAKLVKMQAQREGEAALGNTEAAEAFAAMINKMLIEHELEPSAIDYARAKDSDPVIEIRADLGRYKIPKKKTRIAWQESLARTVANAHLCTFLIAPGCNTVWFVGTRSHATVAEYAYGTLVPLADRMAQLEMYRYGAEIFKREGHWRGKNGFRESWLAAFVARIDERFKEARKAAVAEAAPDVPGGQSQALVRLSGALKRAQDYVNDKFKKSSSRASGLMGLNSSANEEGRTRGRAAADRMTLGKAVGAAAARGLLK